MNQAMVQNGVALGVLKKSLDVDAALGAQLVKILDQTTGLGGRVDLQG
jgi:hypothetical protein